MKPALYAPRPKPQPEYDRTVHVFDAEGREIRTLDPGPPGYICEMHREKNCRQGCSVTATIRSPRFMRAMNRNEG